MIPMFAPVAETMRRIDSSRREKVVETTRRVKLRHFAQLVKLINA